MTKEEALSIFLQAMVGFKMFLRLGSTGWHGVKKGRISHFLILLKSRFLFSEFFLKSDEFIFSSPKVRFELGDIIIGLFRWFLFMLIYAKLCDITGRHYNTWNSDVSLARAPCGLGGGDG